MHYLRCPGDANQCGADGAAGERETVSPADY